MNAPKSVDVEGDVREGFESSIKAGDITKAPWDDATAWILSSVNNDLIGKFNADAAKELS